MTASFPSLKDRVILVTGGASGIGAALVRGFARQGAVCAFLDMDQEQGLLLADTIASEIGAKPHFAPVDLTDIAALRQAIEDIERRLGPVRVLVNNAARDDRGSLATLEPEAWRRALAVNLDHYAFAIQAVRAGMARAGGGSVINLSSNNVLMGAADMAAYITAKAGIVGLTRALARELGPESIRVNAVMPGWVMTDRQRALWAKPEALATARAEQCLNILIQPDDIVGLVLFLAADESRIITKQVFVADAGRA